MVRSRCRKCLPNDVLNARMVGPKGRGYCQHHGAVLFCRNDRVEDCGRKLLPGASTAFVGSYLLIKSLGEQRHFGRVQAREVDKRQSRQDGHLADIK